MEKECIQEISQKLKDVPPGKCLTIRHPSGGEAPVSGFAAQEVPENARLKIITYELYPGIEISYNYFLADRFRSTTATAPPPWRSTTAAGDA